LNVIESSRQDAGQQALGDYEFSLFVQRGLRLVNHNSGSLSRILVQHFRHLILKRHSWSPLRSRSSFVVVRDNCCSSPTAPCRSTFLPSLRLLRLDELDRPLPDVCALHANGPSFLHHPSPQKDSERHSEFRGQHVVAFPLSSESPVT